MLTVFRIEIQTEICFDTGINWGHPASHSIHHDPYPADFAGYRHFFAEKNG